MLFCFYRQKIVISQKCEYTQGDLRHAQIIVFGNYLNNRSFSWFIECVKGFK